MILTSQIADVLKKYPETMVLFCFKGLQYPQDMKDFFFNLALDQSRALTDEELATFVRLTWKHLRSFNDEPTISIIAYEFKKLIPKNKYNALEMIHIHKMGLTENIVAVMKSDKPYDLSNALFKLYCLNDRLNNTTQSSLLNFLDLLSQVRRSNVPLITAQIIVDRYSNVSPSNTQTTRARV